MVAIEYEIYKPSNRLTFILTDDATIVYTGLQTFVITPARHIYKMKLERLRNKIRNNEIDAIWQVVEHCKYSPGNKGQMKGLEMVSTRLDRYVKVQ